MRQTSTAGRAKLAPMEADQVTPDWLRQKIADTRSKHHEVAHAAGIGDRSAIGKILSGTRKISLEEAVKLLVFFRQIETNPNTPLSVKSERTESTDFVSIPRFDLTLSGGGGLEILEENALDRIPFTRRFIEQRIRKDTTRDLIMVDASGDSMEPVISSGDLLMIDRSKRDCDGSILGFRYQGVAMVKRLTRVHEGILVTSENTAVPNYTIPMNDGEELEIYGRVCWIGRTV